MYSLCFICELLNLRKFKLFYVKAQGNALFLSDPKLWLVA